MDMFEHTAPVPMVTVYAVDGELLALLKVTVSAEVGTPAPPAPPELDAQLVVVDASHVPDPPTQKYAAI
jgi:hypothetical protein